MPGFERLIYERLVPLAFEVPSQPDFNIKDAQTLGVSRGGVLPEIGGVLILTEL